MAGEEPVVRVVNGSCDGVFSEDCTDLAHFFDVQKLHAVVWWAGDDSVLSDPVYSVDGVIVKVLGGDKIDRFLVKVTFFLFLFSFIEFLIFGQEILRNLMNQHIA